MKCSRCQFENPDGMKFCGECGSKLETICPGCSFPNPPNFNKAIEAAKEIGAKFLQGQAYLDLGRLHNAKGRSDQARDCFTEAAEILEVCESEVFLKQANEALASL